MDVGYQLTIHFIHGRLWILLSNIQWLTLFNEIPVKI